MTISTANPSAAVRSCPVASEKPLRPDRKTFLPDRAILGRPRNRRHDRVAQPERICSLANFGASLQRATCVKCPSCLPDFSRRSSSPAALYCPNVLRVPAKKPAHSRTRRHPSPRLPKCLQLRVRRNGDLPWRSSSLSRKSRMRMRIRWVFPSRPARPHRMADGVVFRPDIDGPSILGLHGPR